MSGSVVRAIPKQVFDFSGLAGSSNATILGAKQLDVSQWREVNGIVRLHAIPGMAGGITWQNGATVVISARIDAPTSEDPNDFTTTTDLASVTFTQGTDTPPTVRLFNRMRCTNPVLLG